MTAITPDDADFRQFATFDRPVQPPLHLKDSLMWSLAAPTGQATVHVEQASPDIQPTTSVSGPAERKGHQWMKSLEVAAAILVAVSLIGSLFALNQPGRVRTYLAFQPEDGGSIDVNQAGDAGGSWVVGDADPDDGRCGRAGFGARRSGWARSNTPTRNFRRRQFYLPDVRHQRFHPSK